jgi:hypothetical protein
MRGVYVVFVVVTLLIVDQARFDGYYTDEAARVLARVIR